MASFTTDWRFSPARSKEIVKALIDAKRRVSYAEIESTHRPRRRTMTDAPYVRLMRALPEQCSQEVGA